MARIALTAITALSAFALPHLAQAADADIDDRLRAQQAEIEELKKEIQELKQAQQAQPVVAPAPVEAAPHPAPIVENTGGAEVSLADGRIAFATPDGNFSAALHSLVQFDAAWYNQEKAAAGVELSNGSNFRRAQIGVDGTMFKDWYYNITLDFGGSSIEKSGYIYYAFIQYNGLRPFAVRVGALTPFLTIDDATGSGDLPFLERAAPVDLARNIAGGPSRKGVDLFAEGNRYLASVAFTGAKVGASAVYDQQEALVGRGAYLAYDGPDNGRLLLDGGGTYVLKVPATAAGPNVPTPVSLGITPELTVDSTGTELVATPNINAVHEAQWDLDAAGTWLDLYGQGGYFRYAIERAGSLLPNPNFSGWYAQATWVFTGENRPYDPGTASFRNPLPNHPLGSGGSGAWELGVRYSDLDLNYLAGLPGIASPADGIRGGDQRIWTFGLNWYPNNIFHFAVDYQLFNVNRLTTTGGYDGYKGNAVSIRSQFAF